MITTITIIFCPVRFYNVCFQASSEKRRSDVLQQRAELLKQLAEMDKIVSGLWLFFKKNKEGN